MNTLLKRDIAPGSIRVLVSQTLPPDLHQGVLRSVISHITILLDDQLKVSPFSVRTKNGL